MISVIEMANGAERLTQSVTSKCHELLIPSKAKQVSIKHLQPHRYLNVTADRLRSYMKFSCRA